MVRQRRIEIETKSITYMSSVESLVIPMHRACSLPSAIIACNSVKADPSNKGYKCSFDSREYCYSVYIVLVASTRTCTCTCTDNGQEGCLE